MAAMAGMAGIAGIAGCCGLKRFPYGKCREVKWNRINRSGEGSISTIFHTAQNLRCSGLCQRRTASEV